MTKNSNQGGSCLKLCKASLIVECAFGHFLSRFGILQRAMCINMDELPNSIHACFVFNNYCEVNGESVSEGRVKSPMTMTGNFSQALS